MTKDQSALDRDFFRRDVLVVARELLGTELICTSAAGSVRLRVTETEAYHERERGSHSFGGKRTQRNAVMFGDGGAAYVYFIYGMYWMLNVVTGLDGEGAAVLLRAGLPMAGLDIVQKRRGWGETRRAPRDLAKWCDGPGKVAQALAVDRDLNGTPLQLGQRLWFESGVRAPESAVVVGPRVGIDYAGEDALLPWRFRVQDQGDSES